MGYDMKDHEDFLTKKYVAEMQLKYDDGYKAALLAIYTHLGFRLVKNEVLDLNRVIFEIQTAVNEAEARGNTEGRREFRKEVEDFMESTE